MAYCSKYGTCLTHFYEYLHTIPKSNLTMGIGISVIDPLDIERNLIFDIKMTNYYSENNELKKYLEKTVDELIPTFILNYDFNSFCILSKGIITKYNDINKIKIVVFDSSTFKFLNNIKFIGLLYYLTLEQNGNIYIESNNSYSHGFLISKIDELYKYMRENNNGFKLQSAFTVSDNLLKTVPTNKLDDVKKYIWTTEQIYSHNITYLEKNLYGSKVELIENDNYPIINPRYPIKKYYKITKVLNHKDILNNIEENIKEFDNNLGLKSNSLVKVKEFR